MGDLTNLGQPPQAGVPLGQLGQARPADPMMGYKIREQLFPGEDTYFRANPSVSGMAAETGHVILNPYSSPDVNRSAVAKNEALRLHLRDRNITPDFGITDEQRKAFAGTSYGVDDNALKATIAARIYSGDPSANATPEQQEWLARLLGGGH
jgi:hypothetical protein